jgi:hemerythrin superfamily protein
MLRNFKIKHNISLRIPKLSFPKLKLCHFTNINSRNINSQSQADETPCKDIPKPTYNPNEYKLPIEEVIIDDHKRILSSLQQFNCAKTKDNAIDNLKNFILELARHSIAEELLVYPLYRSYIPNGVDYWVRSIDQHWRMRTILSKLEHSVPYDDLICAMSDLKGIVEAHLAIEEDQILPELMSKISAEQRIQLSEAFYKRRFIYPLIGNVFDRDPSLDSLVGLFLDPPEKYDFVFKPVTNGMGNVLREEYPI